MVSIELAEFPFYRDRLGADGEPEPWTLDSLEDYAVAHRDPFAGRVIDRSRARVSLQLEATSEPPVWTALEAREVETWAAGLGRLWHRFGLAANRAAAFFDYGSSPLVLLSSSSFLAYLRRGALDRLGVTAVCNDGVASMAARMITILENVRPQAMVIRRDLLAPFADAVRTTGARIDELRWIAVTEPDGAPSQSELDRYRSEWRPPIRRLLRADAAFFIAGDCDACGLFHVDPRLYRLESVRRGEVTLTTRFARLCPVARYSLGPAELAGPGCGSEPRAQRLILD